MPNGPQVVKRTLTFTFTKAAVGADSATYMDVVITPLADASGEVIGASVVGGAQRQNFALTDDASIITFELVPSNSPGLNTPVNYRVAWRAGVLGRTFTYDFAMPDADTAFEDLADLGAVIDGRVYLQQSDLGVAGRVARLNSQGQVVDANGDPVTGAEALTSVQSAITAETSARQNAISALSSTLNDQINTQIAQANTAAQGYAAAVAQSVNTQVSQEATSRTQADAGLQSQISAHGTAISNVTSAMNVKADLDSGNHLVLAQVPPQALNTAVSCADVPAMLALTPTQVQPGDIAVLPTGTWMLTESDPSKTGNWQSLSTVTSVNGQTGDVSLNSTVIGALPLHQQIPLTQVSGLGDALDAKADVSVTSSLQTQITAVGSAADIVRTTAGRISDAVLPVDVAVVNSSGAVTKLDGTVIINKGGGQVSSVNNHVGDVQLTSSDVGALAQNASIPISQVTSLQTTLSTLVSTDDSRLTNARTPLAHAATHGAGGSDPLTPSDIGALAADGSITLSQVTGLQTSLSTITGDITALGTRVSSLEGGSSAEVVSWTAASLTDSDVVADLTGITLQSPFGVDTAGTVTGTAGKYYLDPTGAASTDVLWPYISPNGHLQLRKWDESGPADPSYATESDFQAQVTSTATALSTLSGDVSALTTAQASKADLVDGIVPLDQIPTDIPSTSIVNLTTDLAAKADLTSGAVPLEQLPTDIPQTSVAGLATALSAKADLVDGTLDPTQMPVLTTASVTGLVDALNAKASLVGGTVPAGQLPTSQPLTYITGLNDALAAKAPLVDGVVPLAYMADGLVTSGVSVNSQAAMLTLTSANVSPGDLCVVTGGSLSTQGTYLLQDDDPSVLSHWLQVSTNNAAGVSSVNGQTGAVTLTAANVGALATSAQIPSTQVTGLPDFTTFVTATQLQTTIDDSASYVKLSVNYATTTLPSAMGGFQTVDGTVTANGDRVLIATPDNAGNYNGIWVVSSASWQRTTGMTDGSTYNTVVTPVSHFTAGTIVVATGGATNAGTLWQETADSGQVGVNEMIWELIGHVKPQLVYTPGTGIDITNDVVSAKVVTGGGLAVGASGVYLDSSVIPVAGAFAVPGVGTSGCVHSQVGGTDVWDCTITHGFGTSNIMVRVNDVTNGQPWAVGTTIPTTGAGVGQNVVLRFYNSPSPGQYMAMIFGIT